MRRTLDWIRGYDRWKLDSPPETEEEEEDETDWDSIREAREDVQREREERGEW